MYPVQSKLTVFWFCHQDEGLFVSENRMKDMDEKREKEAR